MWSAVLTTSAQGSRPATDEASAARISSIYEQHHARIYRIALRYGGGRADWAEDIVQDVFMKLVNHVDSLHDDPGRWLSRVTTNRCLNVLRRERRWQLVARVIPGIRALAPSPDPELLLDMRESARDAYLIVQSLPPMQRAAFFMYRLEGLTQEEIAHTLGHSKGYINKLIRRADTQLAAANWTQEDHDHEP